MAVLESTECFVTYLCVDFGFGGRDTDWPLVKPKTQEMSSNVALNER